jgi:hypothetical protein
MAYTGRCACGAVTLQISGSPLGAAQCWCRQCQAIAAGGPTHNAIFAAAAVAIQGVTTAGTWDAASGNTAAAHFCPSCGTQIYGQSSSVPGLRAIRLGVIDQPHDIAPQMVIWTRDAPAWAVFDPKLPHMMRQPGASAAGGER